MNSCAVRSSWPPLPRAYAIHLPSGENIGNRLDRPEAGTITLGVPQPGLVNGITASEAPDGASPEAVAKTSCVLSGDQSGCVAFMPPVAMSARYLPVAR